MSRSIREHLRNPGADRDSLKNYLQESERLHPEEAGRLAGAVTGRLNRETFPALTEMELILTEDCDQRCDYCFVEGKNRERAMDREIAREAVDYLFRESRGSRRVRILFFGGEPLLEFDLLKEIVEYGEARAEALGKSVAFNMTTNAALLDVPRCEFLARHRVSYLVSIDGPREVHDRHRRRPDGQSSYQLIADKIPMMRKYQPWLGARLTVHPDTVERLAESFSHLVELGFSQFLIGPATGIAWPDGALDGYRDLMIEIARRLRSLLAAGRKLRVNTLEESLQMRAGKKRYRGCRAGRQSVTVTGDGLIYPCSKMLGVMGREVLQPLGSLGEGITAIGDRLRYCGLVDPGPSACTGCRWEDICAGGCFAVNWQETGDMFQPAPSECRLQERTVELMRSAEPILGEEYFRQALATARRRYRGDDDCPTR